MKGLILAGGLGTRLRPFTHTGPKQLIPIANKPVIFYVIEDLVEAGINDIGIIVGYTEERINAFKEAIGDGSRWGTKIEYIEQDAPKGLAHAVYCAKEYMGEESFAVYLGDNILKGGIRKFVEKFKGSNDDAMILLAQVEDPTKYGVALLNENMDIIELEEKPKKPKSDLAIVGVYLFTPIIFNAIDNIKPSKRGELEITEAIRLLVKSEKINVSAVVTSEWWDDTGKSEAILEANHIILSEIKREIRGEIEDGTSLIGNIQIGEGSIIKKGSRIRGPVIIGKNCKIGPNTYIGPYTSIGDNTSITSGEIESSIIIGESKIHFDKKIVDSLIGKFSIINSSTNTLPKGYRFIVGEHSELQV